jgi:hypothetical protein
VVEYFAKKQKEAKNVPKEEDVKSNAEMTEGKNEISVRHIEVIADGLRHIYAASCHHDNHSRFKGMSDIFV